MRRELAIVLRARVTWFVAAAAALLVGHGFVLAIDLYAAASRSALASALQTREMDPLAGVVVPTLGGLDLALSILVPIVAARGLSIEKERRGFGALCLHAGSSEAVVLRKLAAAAVACAPLFVAPLAALALFALAGGHVDLIECALALSGEVLHAALLVAISVAAAAWTATFAQAATIGILASLSSWAIDAADGFAALAWLGGAEAWSIPRRLGPFQHGLVSPAAIAWFALGALGFVLLAGVGARFDLSPRLRAGAAIGVVVATAAAMSTAGSSRRAYDWSEGRRASLPPAIVAELRAIDAPIAIEVLLDRDDSRRRQLETDVLAKLALARPDAIVTKPLDDAPSMSAAAPGDAYGRITIRVGEGSRVTRSTSRRELVTLVLEAAGHPVPEWAQPAYPGFPAVIEGRWRAILGIIVYVAVPAALLFVGFRLSEKRTR